MSGRNRRNKNRRHRRMEEAREQVRKIQETLETENDKEKIKDLQYQLSIWSQYDSRSANHL